MKVAIINKNLGYDIKPESTMAAGLDLRINQDIVVGGGRSEMVGTGLKFEIEVGYMGLVFIRSSIGKQNISLSNSVGVIDSDYRGEIVVSLVNHSDFAWQAFKGDRVAQIVFTRHHMIGSLNLVDESELSNTERGTGGFGSTGVK